MCIKGLQCWLRIGICCTMLTIREKFEDTKGFNQNPYIEEEQTTQWSKEKL